MENPSSALDMSLKGLNPIELSHQAALRLLPPPPTSSGLPGLCRAQNQLPHQSSEDVKSAMASLVSAMSGVTGIPAISRRSSCPEEPCVELVESHLWRRFHSYGTEMVITKSGRYVIFGSYILLLRYPISF